MYTNGTSHVAPFGDDLALAFSCCCQIREGSSNIPAHSLKGTKPDSYCHKLMF